jgi:hypothetical protein
MPFVLAFFSLPEGAVWKISLLVLALGTLGGVLLVLGGFYRLSSGERAVLKGGVVSAVIVILCAMSVVESFAAFGIIRTAPGVFFLGLIVLLGVSTMLVARFLFARPAD